MRCGRLGSAFSLSPYSDRGAALFLSILSRKFLSLSRKYIPRNSYTTNRSEIPNRGGGGRAERTANEMDPQHGEIRAEFLPLRIRHIAPMATRYFPSHAHISHHLHKQCTTCDCTAPVHSRKRSLQSLSTIHHHPPPFRCSTRSTCACLFVYQQAHAPSAIPACF